MSKKDMPDSKWNRCVDALDGTVGTPSTGNKYVTEQDSRLQGEVTVLEAAVAVSNDASLCTLLSVTVSADTLLTGTTIEVEALGSIACASGASLTGMWKFVYGDTIGTGTVLLTMDQAIMTSDLDTGWYLRGVFTVQEIGGGSTGTIIGNAVLLGSWATANQVSVSKIVTAVNIDTEHDQVFGLAFIWSGAATANSMTIQNGTIKIVKRGKLSV
jgi:hypothetical protein